MGRISRNVLLRLIQAILKEEELEVISQIISADPNLTAKILKFVNSAYCGLRREIHSVKDAVAYIGYGKLKEIAFSLLVSSTLKNATREELFHLVQFAYLMKALARRTLSSFSDDAFLVGILTPVYKEEGESLIKELEKVCVSKAVIEGLRTDSSPLGKLKVAAEKLLPWCEKILKGEKELNLPQKSLKKEIIISSCLESKEEAEKLIEIL